MKKFQKRPLCRFARRVQLLKPADAGTPKQRNRPFRKNRKPLDKQEKFKVKTTKLHLMATMLMTAIFCTLTTHAKDNELDFGDHSSATITAKAWSALGKGKNDEAIAYANKCIELHGKEALKMQGKLKDFATEEEAHDHWALNDVGTCYYVKGQALANSGKKKEAIEIYEELKTTLKFAQCWDPNGWFWRPAESASDQIAELKE